MPPLKLRRWSRAEYDRLIAGGVFDADDRIELLDGLLVVKEPQGSWHAATVSHIQRVFSACLKEMPRARATAFRRAATSASSVIVVRTRAS
jgi:hypothetical protein